MTEQHPARCGRPGLTEAERSQMITLCSQGHSMREIAAMTNRSVGAVHRVIKEARAKTRLVHVYMDRDKPSTIVDACSLVRSVRIINLTDDLTSRAFGINEHPDWEDYLFFLEDRCMPRTRYGIREELRNLGLTFYDPVAIIDKTQGRVYGDGQWMFRLQEEEIIQVDLIFHKKAADKAKMRLLLYSICFEASKAVPGGGI